MNTRLFPVRFPLAGAGAALIGSLFIGSLGATPEKSKLDPSPRRRSPSFERCLRPGDAVAEVVNQLDLPVRIIDSSYWVYFNPPPNLEAAANPALDTLVVRVAERRILDLHLVNGSFVRG